MAIPSHRTLAPRPNGAGRLGPLLAASLVLLAVSPAGPWGAPGQAAAQESDAAALETHAEATGWSELTPYDEVVSFFRQLTTRSDAVRLRELGESPEGRALLEVVISDPPVAEPWEVHGVDRPVVYIVGQVHGDEPAGKEGLMLFARELVEGDLQPLLEEVSFVLVPQANPDGAEAGQAGTRANARGRNLNRDYLRIHQPETRAIVERGIAAWRPHVIIDAHELVGPPRVHDFYMHWGRDFMGPDPTHQLTRDEIVPTIVQALEDEGYSYFHYHTPPSPDLVDDPSTGVSPGAHGARWLTDYGMTHGAISILYESLRPRDSRDGIEDRAVRHAVAFRALGEYVADHPERVVEAVAGEREEVVERGRQWDSADSIAVELEEVAGREEAYRIEVDGEMHDFDVPVLDSVRVVTGRVRPVGYLVEPHRTDVVRHLARHGVQVERLEEAAVVEAESYEVERVERAEAPFEGYVERTFETDVDAGEVEAPAGSWLVPADQPNARVAFTLLEPENPNSLFATGALATEERSGVTLPIHRLRETPAQRRSVVTRTGPSGAPEWAPGERDAVADGGAGYPDTYAERVGWQQLTPHPEVRGYFRELAARHPHVHMSEIGRSREGRALDVVVASGSGIRTPWEAHASGKPVLLIGAQVHGDEPAGKEGLMLFARDVVEGPLEGLLDEMVFLFVPQLNPDGGEAEPWGSRANRAGFNLNRDYLRLDNPETRAFVQEVMLPWRPHVVVDAHELAGPPRVYDFYTWQPTNPHGPSATVDFTDRRLIPAIVDALEAGGWSHLIYHTPGGLVDAPEEGIFVPVYGRTLNDYSGAQGMHTILYESLRERDARPGIQDRSERQRVAMQALAEAMAEHAPEVRESFHEGRREMRERGRTWDEADEIVVRREPAPSDTIDYRVAEFEEVEDEDGTSLEWTGDTRTVRAPLYDDAEPTLTRTRPVAYLVSPERGDLVQHLLDHGIRVERVGAETEWAVESFRVTEVETGSQPYEGHMPQEVQADVEEREMSVPEGAYLVRADQPGAALVFHLMEPEDENSFATTGNFMGVAAEGELLPVHRVREIPAVPLLGVEGPVEP